MRRRLPVRRGPLLAAALPFLAACGDSNQARETVSCTDEYRPVAATMRRAVSELGLSGGSFRITEQGLIVCSGYFGEFSPSTTVNTLSGAKWLSAAAIMALVDAGQLRLADTVSKVIPSFTSRGPITLRQLLSHTSGLPDYHDCMFTATTLEQCAAAIAADAQQLAAPGAEFRYGGAAFTVAGRVAEIAAGKPWAQIFSERLTTPLALAATYYPNGQNPLLSEGAYSSLSDFTAFLVMFLDSGSVDGVQVLSKAAVTEMVKNQTAGATVVASPRPGVPYGIGIWVDSADGSGTVQVSSPGGGGFVPWVDFRRRVTGVFMVYDDLSRTYSYATTMMQQVRAIVDNR